MFLYFNNLKAFPVVL